MKFSIIVNPDITTAHTVAFERLILEINKRGLVGIGSNCLVVKAALESGLMLGAKTEEVDGMKTGRVNSLAKKATEAFWAEMKPVDDPN
jgi:hypothetical protein